MTRVSAAAALVALALLPACKHPPPDGRFQGTVEYDERTLAFEVPGRIRMEKVVRGTELEEGALVATLDDRIARGERAVKQAQLDEARAQLALVRAGSRREDVRAALADLDSARTDEDIARRTLERDRGLVTSGALPAAQLDAPERQLAQAEARRHAAEEKNRELHVGARPQEVDAAEARVQAAEASLSTDDVRLGRYALSAPIRGRVLDVLRREGEMVAAGTPVVRMADTRHPFVDVYIPQGDLGGIHVGSKAHVQVDAQKDLVPGAVEDVGREVEFTPRFVFSDRERPNLMTRVRVRLDDPGESLHAGVPAFATIDRDPR